MPQLGPIPSTDAEFNDYINRSIPHLNTNRARLKLEEAMTDDLVTDLGLWNSVYPKSQDPDQRTTTITNNKNRMKKNIAEKLRAAYADIPRSALSQQDRQVLRLKERDSIPSVRPAIETPPTVSAKAMAGARVEFICRRAGDSNRPSMHEHADAIEICYATGQNPPAGPDDCGRADISTTSRFVIELKIADAGKRIYAFLRWRNNAEPKKSGPWSHLVSVVITD
jgi:hypothetical protein